MTGRMRTLAVRCRIVLLVFIQREGVKLGIRGRSLPMAATCLIGVSGGPPFFLYLRERQRPGGT